MQAEFMRHAIYNKPRLNLGESCEALGLSTSAGYTHRLLGKYPVNMFVTPLAADVGDVALAPDYLPKLAKVRVTER